MAEIIRRDEEWRKDALCATEANTEDFFPLSKSAEEGWTKQDYQEAKEKEAQAKEICGRCAVIEQCLDYALKHNIPHGIWGGLNEDERIKLKKKQDQFRRKQAS